MSRSPIRPPSTALALCSLALVGLALGGPGMVAPALGGLRPGVCDADTVTTFVGLDTRAGRALFHLADPSGERPPALLDIPSEGGLAFYHRPGRRVFGGSVGPGPVLAFERCGDGCLEVFRWRSWAWTSLGDRLEIPAATTVHATYDRSGAAWVVLLGETATRGRHRVWAHRWEEEAAGGSRWHRHGPLTVDAVGEPVAVPDPSRPDAILVGTGRLVPDDLARSWLPSLPALPRERMAEVFPLAPGAGGERAAVVLTADAEAYLTVDAGATWQRAPWRGPEGEGPELWLDRPTGDRSGPLGAVWVDARAPRPQLLLTEVAHDPQSPGSGGWKEVARIPSEVVVGDKTLVFEHYLRPDGRRWWLLTPCFDTPETSGIVVRGPDDLETPRFLSIADP